MAETTRVEYVVQCDKHTGPKFRGWFAKWRARREARHFDRVYGCGPHRVVERFYVVEHATFTSASSAYWDEPFTERTITERVIAPKGDQ